MGHLTALCRARIRHCKYEKTELQESRLFTKDTQSKWSLVEGWEEMCGDLVEQMTPPQQKDPIRRYTLVTFPPILRLRGVR